jgi:hypothetical protein
MIGDDRMTTLNKFDFIGARAYANGALDGYNEGSNKNPYDNEEEPLLYYVYEAGYAYGVALYCHDQEENEEITE